MTGPKLDLAAILGNRAKPATGRPRSFTPEVSAARKKEATRRLTRARTLAYMALVDVYRDEFDELLAQAKAAVEDESGPLPGDEVQA